MIRSEYAMPPLPNLHSKEGDDAIDETNFFFILNIFIRHSPCIHPVCICVCVTANSALDSRACGCCAHFVTKRRIGVDRAEENR